MDATAVIKALTALERRSEDFTDKAALLAAVRVLTYLRGRAGKQQPHAVRALAHLVIEP